MRYTARVNLRRLPVTYLSSKSFHYESDHEFLPADGAPDTAQYCHESNP